MISADNNEHPYMDRQNASVPSLLIGLSHYAGAALWVAHDGGRQFLRDQRHNARR